MLGGSAIFVAGPDQKPPYVVCVLLGRVRLLQGSKSSRVTCEHHLKFIGVYVPCSAHTVLDTENNVLILRIIFAATQLQKIIRKIYCPRVHACTPFVFTMPPKLEFNAAPLFGRFKSSQAVSKLVTVATCKQPHRYPFKNINTVLQMSSSVYRDLHSEKMYCMKEE